MKQIYHKSLFLCVLSFLGINASAYDCKVDGIFYNLNEIEKTASVTYERYSYYYSDNAWAYKGSVMIPSSFTYSGTTYSVTSIGDHAFYECRGLTSVIIPNSVTNISEYAFQYCRGLTSIDIPNSVTSISYRAFSGCSGLTDISIGNSLISIGSFAFEYCSGLTSITIPNSVLIIGYGAFLACSALETVVVESSNKVYDSRNRCNAIIETNSNTLITGCKSTVIPNSVISIGVSAFHSCSGLTSISIPSSIISIGDYAFYACELESIAVESGNKVYDSRNQCNAIIETATNTLIFGCKNTIIPNSVTTIGDGAFSGCTELTSIDIPNSVTTIGGSAFSSCSGLTSIIIPNSVTSIGESAFYSCSSLTSIDIPNSVTCIESNAFSYCRGLTYIDIPNSITIIGSGAFFECSGLISITIPNSVTTIESGAFQNCSNLLSIDIPNSMTTIGDWAFNGCCSLARITSYMTSPPSVYYLFEENVYDNATLYVPSQSLELYKTTEGWKYFKNIVPFNPVSFEVTEMTLDDPEKWNDLSTDHILTIKGNRGGSILYSVDRDSEWQPSWPAPGEEFTYKLFVTFDVTKPIHTIKLCEMDGTGDRTMLPSIEFVDVSYLALAGIQEKTFTGDSLFQSDLICDLSDEMYVVKGYQNNVNAGTASFNLEGVFPYSIGRKTYNFTIQPQTLTGEVVLSQTSFVYDGHEFTPNWQFSKDSYAQLIKDQDYTVTWTNNKTPGLGTLTVTGKNNYTGTLSATFNIDKGELTDELFTLNLPNEDITYDARSHGATITTSNGVGAATISYQKKGTTRITTTEPTDEGDYTVYLEFADGTLYYGRERTEVGSFSIYKFSDDEWAVLESLQPKLKSMRWSHPWNLSQGKKSVSSLQGLTIEKGHITELNLSNQNLTGNFPFEVLTLPCLKNLDLSNNYITGNLGAVANCSPVLTTLNASNNCFEDVIPLIPATVTNLDISKQTIARVVPLHLFNFSIETILPSIPSILIYDHTHQTYTPNINLLLTTADNNWSVSLFYQNWLLTMLCASEQNVYYGENGDTLNVAVVNNDGTLEGSTFRMSLSFEEGDGNFDGKVNILDLQTMLNFMFEEYNDKPFNFTASNLCKESHWGRNDQVINVQDAVCLVNKLLDTSTNPVPVEAKARHSVAFPSEPEAEVLIEDGYLIINSTVPVSAFDIVVSTNQKCELVSALNEIGFTCSVKASGSQVHLIGYSLSGTTLPMSECIICRIDDGTIVDVMFADKNAEEITCAIGETATNISTSRYKAQSKEIYRIPWGSRRTIVIDAAGKKTMIKDEK